MAVRCAVVILGVSIPIVVDETSSIAEASGAAPVVLIPTFCDQTLNYKIENTLVIKFFIILFNKYFLTKSLIVGGKLNKINSSCGLSI